MTIGEQFPRPWLRASAIGVAMAGFLWIATGVAWKFPNGWLTVLVGLFLLPLGIALIRNLDGMATVWGRRALAPLRIRARNDDLDEETRERVATVREEGVGRQAGGGLVLMALGWILLGLGILAGALHGA
jgi:hypothetical protein